MASNLGKKAKSAAICLDPIEGTDRRVFEHKALHESDVLQLVKQDILQPALSIYWLSDVKKNTESEPD